MISEPIRRRQFLTLLGGAAATWPLAARAQQSERRRRLGVLMFGAESDPDSQLRLKIALETLRIRGWSEGRNIELHVRWPLIDGDHLRHLASELVSLLPDAILTYSAPITLAVMRETSTIPIVFAGGSDPVVAGLVPNLARPGGNVTGFPSNEPSLGGKWFSLLNEMVPNARRLAVVEAPDNLALSEFRRAIDNAVAGRLERIIIAARDAGQIEREIEAFSRVSGGVLIVINGLATNFHKDAIISAAAKYRLPTIYSSRQFISGGGLMSYGADSKEQLYGAATYIDRILRGEKPGDLPVQLPTKFELVINMKTAKALGLTVPNTLLVSADEVIE